MRHAIARLPNARALVDRILEQPELVSAVRALEPNALKRLIEHVGLEDAGELVALATHEQLERVFDEDLWSADAPGVDDTFDAERFALWLEVLVDQGAALAARKIAELDEDFVTLALSKQVFVIDIEQLAQTMSQGHTEEDDLLEKRLESGLYHEFEEYRVISRNPRSWDAVLTVLVELHAQDFAAFSRLVGRCCDISTEVIEGNGGLYDVLTAEEMNEGDVAGDRENRRERAGYVAPSAAVSFLKLACITPIPDILAATESDPVTRAHFRAARFKPLAVPNTAPEGAAPEGLPKLLATLQAADVLPVNAAPKALGQGAGGKSELPLLRAMSLLRDRDEALYSQRMLELAYLANVLLAGCGTRARRLRPVEAAEGALAVCNFGAEHAFGKVDARGSREAQKMAEKLVGTDLVKLFQVGFARLAAVSERGPLLAQHPELELVYGLLKAQGAFVVPR